MEQTLLYMVQLGVDVEQLIKSGVPKQFGEVKYLVFEEKQNG